MQSKIQPIQSKTTTSQSSQGNQVVDHPKPPISSQRNPTNIQTWEMPKIDYNVVEDLKKMKDNVFFMDMCRIPQQKDFLLQALKLIDTPMTSIDQGDVPSPTDLTNKPSVNACSLEKRGRPFVPPFLLMFEVFNKNIHNFLVDSEEY
jgi:hypothetical protein